MKTLVVLDFDGCITDTHDRLTRSRADNIARMMNKYRDLDTEFIILTMANHAHVMKTVKDSHSTHLYEIFSHLEIISIENRKYLTEMDLTRKESIQKRNKMVHTIIPGNMDPLIMNDDQLTHAYKKSNSLLHLAHTHHISHDNIFFLDDNLFNIKFAVEHGFRAFYVYNHKTIKTLNLLHLLEKIEAWLRIRQDNTEIVYLQFNEWKKRVENLL
jgi:FMN phosphatase YigB (HAD superfamily)